MGKESFVEAQILLEEVDLQSLSLLVEILFLSMKISNPSNCAQLKLVQLVELQELSMSFWMARSM